MYRLICRLLDSHDFGTFYRDAETCARCGYRRQGKFS